jgi:hypothetical protein
MPDPPTRLPPLRRFPHPSYTYDVYVATSGSVKLLDFNPAGGTTAPLLFTWTELAGAELAGAERRQAAQQDEPSAVDEAGCQEARQAGAASQPGAAAGAGGEARAASAGCGCGPHADQGGDAPQYLEQLRRVQALSLADCQPQQDQQQQQQDPAAAARGAPAGAPAPAAAAAAAASPAFELRIIEEAVALRPAAAAYGVPYDFVDSSEGSALERLMAQMQGAGAAEAWEALAAEAEGAGRQAAN